MKVKIKIVDPKAVVPYKKYDRDFCYDCVAVSEEEVALMCGNTASGLPYRERKSREATQYHVSRFVPVLLYGRQVWFSVTE